MSTCQNSSGGTWPFDSLIKVEEAWTLKITVRFLEDSVGYMEEKKTAVLNSIKKDKLPKHRETWEQWANICFEEVTIDDANIRVAFDKHHGSWSYIGQHANEYKGVSLNLGGIDIRVPPEDNDFGTILHEFGHALGLLHEHQSPLRGSGVAQIIRKQSGEYARRVGSQELVDDQMTKAVDQGSIANLSTFDPDSIMMYQIDGVTEEPNNKLSKLDKAFIMLNYPPDLTDYNDEATKERLSRFKKAIGDAGLGSKAGEILQAFQNPGPVLKLSVDPQICHRLQAVRKRFTGYNSTMYFRRSNVNISHSVNPTSMKQYALPLRSDPPFGLTDPTLARRFGLTDPLGDVAKNRLFRSLVKHMVKNALEQRGISMKQSIPGASPTEVARMMAAIGAHEEIAHYVKAYKDDFQGSRPAVARRAQDSEKDDAEEQK